MMSSLYIGATGMIALGEGMQTVSNNLANLNTVAYKERLHLFEDLMSTLMTTPSSALGRNGVLPTSYSQQGQGVRTSAVITRFYETGGIEAGDRVTDMCIGGKGFFKVTQDDKTFYTKAGNFYFNEAGDLVNPGGQNLMGKKLTNGVAGNLEKITLSNTNLTMPAKPTTQATIISGLGLTSSKSDNAANPFFALAASYNADMASPVGSSGYSNAISIYDSAGKKHDITVDYDLAQATSDGRKVVEFVVRMDPKEDARAGFEGSKGAGLLMSGTLTFTSAGVLQNMSAYQPTDGANTDNLATWNSVNIATTGMPINAAFKNIDPKTGAVTTANSKFNLDFGLGFASAGSGGTAASIGTDPNNLPGYTAAGNAPPANVTTKNRTTAYGGNINTASRAQDGYAEGHFSNMTIDRNGTMVFRYDNGQNQEQYQITLYTFQGEQDLKAEGGNLYSETTKSGAAREGVAGEENYGQIYSTSLEMSNVDLGRQFTSMILTQRGFQYNSKIITTSDAMLQKALELKRA